MECCVQKNECENSGQRAPFLFPSTTISINFLGLLLFERPHCNMAYAYWYGLLCHPLGLSVSAMMLSLTLQHGVRLLVWPTLSSSWTLGFCHDAFFNPYSSLHRHVNVEIFLEEAHKNGPVGRSGIFIVLLLSSALHFQHCCHFIVNHRYLYL